jgi:hypothetical protein
MAWMDVSCCVRVSVFERSRLKLSLRTHVRSIPDQRFVPICPYAGPFGFSMSAYVRRCQSSGCEIERGLCALRELLRHTGRRNKHRQPMCSVQIFPDYTELLTVGCVRSHPDARQAWASWTPLPRWKAVLGSCLGRAFCEPIGRICPVENGQLTKREESFFLE